MKFRQPFDYDVKAASDEAAVTIFGESMTVQDQATDADINVMMKRMGITGQMPVNPRVPMYGDFTDVGDFRSALDAVQRAREGFAEFPAEIRARFDNDPQKLLEFCENSANRPEAIRLGLIKEAPAPSPAVVDPPKG